jgi:phosphatidylserine/phosphatidylglycerophosphate/cardiolipin synthase-like enzyme
MDLTVGGKQNLTDKLTLSGLVRIEKMPKRKRRSPSVISAGTVIVLLILVVLGLIRIFGQGGAGAVPAWTPRPSTAPGVTAAATLSQEDAAWYSLYFTDPGSPEANSLRGGPDEALRAAIDGARISLDLAVYEIDLYRIRDALINAQRRGVSVRVVTDSDYLDEDAVQGILEAGIPVLGDRREGFMHNKFAVVDRQEVWTGSMNFTVNDAYRNNNNLVRIRSLELAEDYTVEFDEMFEEDLFGPSASSDTPHPTITVEGTQIEVYFSPDDGTARRLVELLEGAQESIYFLAYSFTSDDIAKAIMERAKAGVTAAGVMETSQYESNQGSEYDRFKKAGLDVRLDGNPRNMHHKVLIIDGQSVVTGSYNFSRNAEEINDENTLIIHNEEIAGGYLAEFEMIFDEAKSR